MRWQARAERVRCAVWHSLSFEGEQVGHLWAKKNAPRAAGAGSGWFALTGSRLGVAPRRSGQRESETKNAPAMPRRVSIRFRQCERQSTRSKGCLSTPRQKMFARHFNNLAKN